MYKRLTIIWMIAILVFTLANSAAIEKEQSETGTLELTEEEYRQLIDGKNDRLPVAKVEDHQYTTSKLFLDRIIIIKPPKDCWDLFDKYMDKYRKYFQTLANRRCENLISCWCCPNGGICITFIVKPTRLCIHIKDLTYQTKIPVFEPQLDIARD